jgi:flavin-dependent dehydrogenase/polyisoprenoid-binding protein YceI
MPETGVFVIGGGPAGLAAAIAARRKGFDVIVADGARPPIDKACGEGLMPDGLAALRSLGVFLDDTAAYPFRGIRFLGAGRLVDASFPEGRGFGVRRTVLHPRMVDCAAQAGVRMLWGTPVSGICREGVRVAGRVIRARWIVGADGFGSRVRHWAGLEPLRLKAKRFGFRIHYHIAPWSDCMELYWGAGCQIYVTPVGPAEVCVVLISRNPRLRLDEALPQFPELSARLLRAPHTTSERGAITANASLERVCRGRIALVGDASGSVDAVTGEGLCLSFLQAIALADSIASGDLRRYQAEHRHLARRPTLMAEFLLAMDRRGWVRDRAMRALASKLQIFRKMLSMHVGARPERSNSRRTDARWRGKCSRAKGVSRMIRSRMLATILAVTGALSAVVVAAPTVGQEMVLELDPARTQVQFTLADVLHTVHGNFRLKHGAIRFDPATGGIGGDIVVDATSGNSGSEARDRRMHKNVLESQRYPEISFKPDRVEGEVAMMGISQVQVHGVFSIHGESHEITVPVQVQMGNGQAVATAHFTIPYAKWGMKNPSTLFLRVSDRVDIDITASTR